MKTLDKIAPRLINYRPPRIAMMLIVIASLLQLTLGDPWHSTAPVTGVVVLLAGFLIMMRAWWLFRINKTAICPTAVTTTFITDDIYAVSRNPMYLGMILMLTGFATIVGSLWILFVTAIYAVILDRVFCRYEEYELLQQYGRSYADYRDHVRRWL